MQERLIALYRHRFGNEPSRVARMRPDGSSRVYFRLASDDDQTAIGVYGPDPDENRAFFSFSESFRSVGLPVPELYAVDRDVGIYLEEDLGDTTLFEALTRARDERGGAFPEDILPAYRRVVQVLPRFQVEGGRVADYRNAYPRAAFDRQSILWDLNYFKYHFLKLAHIHFREDHLEEDFSRLTAFLLRADTRHFLYRDFQSRNIMLRGGEPWFVDYQGGRQGALQYDIASLLYDAKAGIPEEVREELLLRYMDALGEHLSFDRELFRKHYDGYVLVRIMQAMGAYGYRGFFERKPHFLQSVPHAIRNIERLMEQERIPVDLPELTAVFQRICDSRKLRREEEEKLPGLTVRIGSFSYRRGLPDDEGGHGGGFVFDCRALPNPGRDDRYVELCGLDPDVGCFIEELPEAADFWNAARALVDAQVETYLKRGFTSLSVHFGCTGGQHRSVYFAERLKRHLATHFPDVNVRVKHREESHWPRSRAAAGGAPS
ncbi:MAG TPA: RNase adapter RapZ [Longimicrobiales bacterium]|nr:RNase adapter RapZ [Longimicrobiales bacterium]